mmetsp:Transcript_17854/g.25423  ORF Transcript_17854/g.25423 Transcript_17854/m.25423 type:complete len:397 (-) Transcript_17854:151-1341(-)
MFWVAPLFCYEACPSGYKRSGFDCYQVCQDGQADQGLFCRSLEYGRGVGYPWQFGDWFNSDGMFSRCESAEGKGNCEQCLAVVYRKCLPGYSLAGCNICRPPIPACSGYAGRFDLSCTKTVIFGSPKLAGCAPGLEYDAGLCYPPCASGYKGIGPVCWATGPPQWTECGAGYAKDDLTCKSVMEDQIFSATSLLLSVVTAGASEAVKRSSDVFVKMCENYKAMQAKLGEIYKGVYGAGDVDFVILLDDNAGSGASLRDVIQTDPYEKDPVALASMAAKLTGLFDPTGISGVVASFTFPKCSAIIPIPSIDGILVCREVAYQGNCKTLTPGDYNAAKLFLSGVEDNTISSIKVPKGFKVTAYLDDNFAGVSTFYFGDQKVLQPPMNDAISSLKVMRV